MRWEGRRRIDLILILRRIFTGSDEKDAMLASSLANLGMVWTMAGINIGHYLAGFLVMGAIIGAWT